jgi:N-acetylmuramoyl-L-alanine amidase
MKKLMIDVGHGGTDVGANANGLKEKDLNLQVALKVREYLQSYDVEIKMTRETDKTIESNDRVKIVLDFNPDLCVSVHHNSFDTKARGAEVIHSYYETQDDKLANAILDRLVKAGMPKRRAFTKLNDEGKDWYYMIRRINDSDTDSVITEGGFVDNVEDAKLLKTQEYISAEAKAIADSVVEYLGLKLKEVKISEETKMTKQGKILVNLNIRQSNSTTSNIVGKLNINDVVTILEERSDWYRIGENKWIFGNSGKYVEIVVGKTVEKVEVKEVKKEEVKIETPIKIELQYPTIKLGSKGKFVLELQKKLQLLKYVLIADGVFSSSTEKIVKQFQEDNGLTKDGVFGSKSWSALEIAKPKNINTEIPKESTTEKKYQYYKESLTHVVEVDPMALRISVEDVAANKFKANNYVTSGFITWEAMYDKNGIKLDTVRGVPLGILVSEGKVISNRQPHRVSAGTLIIYRTGKVECKPILDIVKETNINDIWFAVSGCSILPSIRMKEEGFKIYDDYFGLGYRNFSDIGRTTLRPVIGFNPTKNKIVIAVRPDSDIARGQLTLKNMGCTIGLTMDAGGSTVLKVDGKILVNSTRQLYSVISW